MKLNETDNRLIICGPKCSRLMLCFVKGTSDQDKQYALIFKRRFERSRSDTFHLRRDLRNQIKYVSPSSLSTSIPRLLVVNYAIRGISLGCSHLSSSKDFPDAGCRLYCTSSSPSLVSFLSSSTEIILIFPLNVAERNFRELRHPSPFKHLLSTTLQDM